jgi:uncharacterized protein (UPF0147 family)
MVQGILSNVTVLLGHLVADLILPTNLRCMAVNMQRSMRHNASSAHLTPYYLLSAVPLIADRAHETEKR